MKSREEALLNIARKRFDVCVIGGGATGAGCALDAQLRGLKTLLVDAGDFGGATSSKSTKIVHGGVRYLEQAVKGLDPAQYRVVSRALQERARMLHNAPHLARPIEFLLPCFRWIDIAYYDIGLKMYDWISRGSSIFPSRLLSKEHALQRIPGLKSDRLVGAVVYADGQFDDARYNLALVESFADAGGEALNYVRVTGFEKDRIGRIRTVEVEASGTQHKFLIQAKAFINATGPYSDTVRTLAQPQTSPRMRLSKGIHILLPLELMPSKDALLIPKTEDGRVMFAIPWNGRLLVGTTEEEVTIHDDLHVTKAEVEYVLHHLNRYLVEQARPEQVVSAIAGARPLVTDDRTRETKRLARDHQVEVEPKSGLVSIMGGKWTTYRAMAEDTVNAVQEQLGMAIRRSGTETHRLAGAEGYSEDWWQTLTQQYRVSESTARHLASKFGTRATRVVDIAVQTPELGEPLLKDMPILRAEVVYCARDEMASTIEDVLCRRTGLELYSWRAAIEAAPAVASLLGRELGWSAEFERAAVQQYVSRIGNLMELVGLARTPASPGSRPTQSDQRTA